jgi:hypothetical protein
VRFCGVDWNVDEEKLSGCVGCGNFGSVGADVEVVGGFFGEGWDCWTAEGEDDEVVDGCGGWEFLYGRHFGGVDCCQDGGMENVAKRMYLVWTFAIWK